MTLFATIENARKSALRNCTTQYVFKQNGEYQYAEREPQNGRLIGEVHVHSTHGSTMYISAAER